MDEQQKEKKSKDILEEAIASVKNMQKEEKQLDENTEKSQEELLKIISDLKSKVSGLEKEIQDDDDSIDEEEIDDNDVTEDASEENIETGDDKYDSELTEKEDSIESQTGNVEKHITPKKKLTILSAFLSILWPGIGQLYVGQYKRAVILLSAPIIAIIISHIGISNSGVRVSTINSLFHYNRVVCNIYLEYL